MDKKESINRGYMTTHDVFEHVQKFKTKEEKIDYLSHLLERKSLLSIGTRASVYDYLGGAYAQLRQYHESREMFGRAKELRELHHSEEKDLGSIAASVISIAGVLTGLALLTLNLTGNAIVSLSQDTSNLIGALILIFGIVGSFILVKRRKK